MTSNELEIFKQSILDEVRVMMQTTGQVTQYIGARYVPLFAEPFEWDINKEYEPLTIVTNQGNSYTSRQFVPKGTPITNEQFWAVTGNFNAQIEQYRQEVAKFDARITAAQNAADSKAPINHATDSTEYGVGNGTNYGHLKLTDEGHSSANEGIAATPKLVDSFAAFVNAKNYGCVGDGVSDDTDALQSCIDYCSENSLTLFIPAGIYAISKALILKDNTHIIGIAPNANIMKWETGPITNGTVIKQTVATENIFTVGLNSDVNSVILKDFAIYNEGVKNQGNNPDNYQAFGKGIYLNRCSKFDIDGVFVAYCSTGMRVNDAKVGDSTPYIDSGERKVISNISITKCYNGLEFSASDAYANNITVSNCAYGVFLSTVKVSGIHLWSIKNRAVNVYRSAKAMVTNLEIEGTGTYSISGVDVTAEIAYEVFLSDGGTIIIDNCLVWNIKQGSNHTIFNSSNGTIIANSLVVLGNASNIPNTVLPRLAWANADTASIVIKQVYVDTWYKTCAADPLVTGNVFIGSELLAPGSTLAFTKEKFTKMKKSAANYYSVQEFNPFD